MHQMSLVPFVLSIQAVAKDAKVFISPLTPGVLRRLYRAGVFSHKVSWGKILSSKSGSPLPCTLAITFALEYPKLFLTWQGKGVLLVIFVSHALLLSTVTTVSHLLCIHLWCCYNWCQKNTIRCVVLTVVIIYKIFVFLSTPAN